MSADEIDIDFKVEIQAIGDIASLSTETIGALHARMETARAAAEAVLTGARPEPTAIALPPMPASLAAAVARLIHCEDACFLVDPDDTVALTEAYEARDLAYATLKNRFEQEFPNV